MNDISISSLSLGGEGWGEGHSKHDSRGSSLWDDLKNRVGIYRGNLQVSKKTNYGKLKPSATLRGQNSVLVPMVFIHNKANLADIILKLP
jgi:hypothetical protein